MAVAQPGRFPISATKRFMESPEGRLYLAAKEGRLEDVAAAVAEGAALDMPHPEFGSPPIIIATMYGHTEVVHFLMEEGAEVETRNKFGWTPLLTACAKGHLQLAGYLITRNADVQATDKLGRTPLHNAVASGIEVLAKGLLEEKADPHARMKDGTTVLAIELKRTRRENKELENLLTERMGLPFPKGYVKEMLADKPPSFALLFPGQGSQRLGMLGWAEEHETAWPMIEKANEIMGFDFFTMCEIGPEEKLDDVAMCQVAVFVAGMCGVEYLEEQEGAGKAAEAAAVAGVSCGELIALCIAGCFDFEDGVRIAKARGEHMKAAIEAEGAEAQKMISIVGLTEDDCEELCEQVAADPGGTCQIGNRLFPTGFALSGTAAAVDAAKALAKVKCAQKVSELKGCAGGFHTELMNAAAEPLRAVLVEMLRTGKLRSPTMTVYSSMTGERWLPGTPPQEILEGLTFGLTNPCVWEDTCRRMIDDGVEYLYEIGPMKQLKAMMRHIDYTQWKNMKCIDV